VHRALFAGRASRTSGRNSARRAPDLLIRIVSNKSSILLTPRFSRSTLGFTWCARVLVAGAPRFHGKEGVIKCQPSWPTSAAGRHAPSRRPRRARGDIGILIVEDVAAIPGSTARAVADALGLKRNSVATRLTGLARRGDLRAIHRGCLRDRHLAAAWCVCARVTCCSTVTPGSSA
jgi:hypothetical protein